MKVFSVNWASPLARAALIAVLLLLTLAVAAAEQSRGSLGRQVGEANRMHGAAGEQVVALVNGRPITLQELEVVRASYQHNPGLDGPVTEAQAYQKAFEHLVQRQALAHEAERRGLTATDAEVEATLRQLWAESTASAEGRQYHADQQQALGLDDRTYRGRLRLLARQALLEQKLDAAFLAEVPAAEQAEVERWMQTHPGPNSLVLVPIDLPDHARAQQLFDELRRKQQSLHKDDFDVAVQAVARDHAANKDARTFHKSFAFWRVEELPDYAQAALTSSAQRLTLLKRADGSATIALTLFSGAADANVEAVAAAQLLEERRQSHIDKAYRRLIQGARVELRREHLPASAQHIAQQ
jgi:hypothetical protein